MRPSFPKRLTRYGLVLIVGLAAAVGCTNDGGTGPVEPPPPTTVRFAVTFASTPLALASIAVTVTAAELPTVTVDLTPVGGTDSRQWTGGPVTIRAGTYAVDIQGKDASDVVTYRGSGTLTIQNSQSRTFAFALVCVSPACQGLGTLTLFVLTPELEVEPNDASGAATPLVIASIFGGQLEMGAASGTINPGSDFDYFSLPFSAVAPGDTIVVQLYGTRFGSSLNAVVALFDPFGAQLIEVDDSPVGADPLIMIAMPISERAGSYQIRVTSSGGSTTGQYTMWAYHCRSGGANSVSCRDPSGSPALSGAAALMLTGAGTGIGRVVSSPAGIDCIIGGGGTSGATGCSETLDGGTGVTLNLTLWTGSTVTGWSGTGSSCAGVACSVTMDQARTVTVTLGGRAGDVNGDGLVNQADLDLVTADFGRTDKPPTDINRDGIVDGRDLGIVLSNWTGAGVLGRVSAGIGHTCGVASSGAAYCWGDNVYGGLGNGTTTGSLIPVAVSGGLTFATVSVGSWYTCGVTTSGAAYCWGENSYGELGNGTTSRTTTSLTPVAVSGGLTFATVSAGQAFHTCGVTTSGAAYCWGQNGSGQLGNGTTAGSLIPVAVSGGLTFASISTGYLETCGVTTSGAAYCWGFNSFGASGNGTATQSTTPVAVSGGLTFAAVSAGFYFTCGVTTSGAAYCWGGNGGGQLGNGTTTGSLIPVAVSGGHTFTTITAGASETCGVTTSGAAYCWGYNGYGELGNGTITNSATPVAVSGGLTFAAVSVGGSGSTIGPHTCGVTTSGAANCWGYNGYGQLGDGTSGTNRLTPVAVSGGLMFAARRAP